MSARKNKASPSGTAFTGKSRRKAKVIEAAPVAVVVETPPDPFLQESNDINWMAKLAAKIAVDHLGVGDAKTAVELLHIAARYAQLNGELLQQMKVEPPTELEKLPPEIRFARELCQSTLMLVQQQVPAAMRIAERSLVIFESNGGNQYPKVEVYICNLAGAVLREGEQFERGLKLLQRAEMVCDTLEGEEPDTLMAILFNLIRAANSLKRSDETARALGRVKLLGFGGGDELKTVPVKLMAAQVMQNEERFEDSLALYQKALAIIDATLAAGKEQVDVQGVVAALSGTVELLHHFGRTAEATPSVERLLAFANQGALSQTLFKLDYLIFDQESHSFVLLKNPDGSPRADVPLHLRRESASTVMPVAADYDLSAFEVPAGAAKN